MEKLTAYLEEHQRRFNIAYPEDSRPKHHAALHLPQMLLQCGKYLHCEVHESKHKVYKSFRAARFKNLLGRDEQWCESLLVRITEAQVETLCTNGLRLRGLFSNPRRLCCGPHTVFPKSVLWLPATHQCFFVLSVRDEPRLGCQVEILTAKSVRDSSMVWTRTGQRCFLGVEGLQMEIPYFWFHQAQDITVLL